MLLLEKALKEALPVQDTGVDVDMLQTLGTSLATYPSDFTVHRNLVKILQTRKVSIENGEGIDWATAESLAFGTLLEEGKHVRLSGQVRIASAYLLSWY
jgi:2-oxoglutarate dehydrogenase E1 component